MNMVMKTSIPEEMDPNHKSQISHWKGPSWEKRPGNISLRCGPDFIQPKGSR